MSISVLNTDAQLSGTTLLNAESSQTVTGLKTFDRGAAAPFAVGASATKVTGLIADKLDDQEGAYYLDPTNLSSAVPIAKGGTGAATAAANVVFAGPTTGSAAAPSFRALVAADLSGSGANAVLDRAVTDVTIASSTTETTLYTFTVPGGTLSTNRHLRLTILGEVFNNTGVSFSWTVRSKWGGSTQLTYAPSEGEIVQNAAVRAFKLELILSANGATNAQSAVESILVGAGAAAGTIGPTAGFVVVGQATGMAIDSTANQTLAVTSQFSISNANLTLVMRTAILEALN